DITGEVIEKARQRRPAELGHYYCQLEQARLCRLLHTWLSNEKTRAPFSVVSVEAEQQITFAGLPLKLRLDRVDRIGDDDYLRIYRTTRAPGVERWRCGPSKEMLLPVSAVTSRRPANAIAFAQSPARNRAWPSSGRPESLVRRLKPPPGECPG